MSNAAKTPDTTVVQSNLKARGLLPLAQKVSKGFYVPLDLLLGPSREKSVVVARRALYTELRARHFSYPEIGRLLQRHHTGILEAMRTATAPAA